MIRFLGTLLVGLLAVGASDACPLTVASYYTPTYYAPSYAPTYYAPTYVPVAFPVAVTVPAYGASYAPAQAATPAPAAEMPGTLDLLKRIDARLSALEKIQAGTVRPEVELQPGRPGSPHRESPAPPPTPPGQGTALPPPGGLNFLAVAQAKCARCHSAAKAAADGGGFVLLQGEGLAPLDPGALLKITRHVYQGTMPPKASKIAPLTDEEVGSFMEYLNGVKFK